MSYISPITYPLIDRHTIMPTRARCATFACKPTGVIHTVFGWPVRVNVAAVDQAMLVGHRTNSRNAGRSRGGHGEGRGRRMAAVRSAMRAMALPFRIERPARIA